MTAESSRAGRLIESVKKIKPFENMALEMSKRIIISSLPMVLISFTLSPVLPFITVFSALALYHMVKDIQHKIIELDQIMLLCLASLPVYLFFLVWCFSLAKTGRTEQISSIAIFFLLAVICLWPTYVNQKKYIGKQKKSPFKPLYLAVSGLLVVQQILIIF